MSRRDDAARIAAVDLPVAAAAVGAAYEDVEPLSAADCCCYRLDSATGDATRRRGVVRLASMAVEAVA